MPRLGLIVNPLAGLGGRVGLKGSDGLDVQRRALALGAEPLANERAAAALEALGPLAGDVVLVTAPGEMGESVARRLGFAPRVVPATRHGDSPDCGPDALGVTRTPSGSAPTPQVDLFGEPRRDRTAYRSLPTTTAADTRAAARAMRDAGIDLLLFAGGDGTARDVLEAIGTNLPAIGIPAGVKIHSAVFGISPRAAGQLAADVLRHRRLPRRECEVVDLDEEAYRSGQIVTRMHGCLMVPYHRARVQNQKVATPAGDAARAASIAAGAIDRMSDDCSWLLGPGTTTRAIASRLGLPKTLVGIDIVTRDAVLALDVGEREILEVMKAGRPLGMIVAPIGGQGFLFGRGNQPISPGVIRRIDRRHLIVVCDAGKLAAFRGEPLLVDTGDPELDATLDGYIEVVTGFRESAIYRVAAR